MKKNNGPKKTRMWLQRMPYALLHNKDGSVRVENVDTGKVYAKHTTAKKAEKQVRLLRAIEHGMDIRKRKKK